MVKDRGQEECFQKRAAIKITKFKGAGILQSILGWLEAGQDFQGIVSGGTHSRHTTLQNQANQVE